MRRGILQTVTDNLKRSITYSYPPKRIISLDPAITETLYHLGLSDEVVGRTRFCIHPKDKINQAVNVGGTKDMKIDRIHDLKPDLIIAEKEENTKEMVETLEADYPVYVFEIQTVDDAFHMIEELGVLTDRTEKAINLKKDILAHFYQLPKATNHRIAYLIWKKPYMAVGRDTYINDMLEKLGFINGFATSENRYPMLTPEDLQAEHLDYLFLSSEPYPFNDKHHEEFLNILPNVTPVNVDGEMFWYGARMLKAAPYFSKLISSLQE